MITEKLRLLETLIDPQELFGSEIKVTPPRAEALPTEIASAIEKEFVVLHPTPLTTYKRWPLAHWASLIEDLSPRYQVILSGAPIAQVRELNHAILDLLSPEAKSKVLNLDGRLKLDQLGTLLRKAALYIGVDTSVTHLAAACDTPTITLFGATPPTNFGPWPNGFIGQQPYQLQAAIQKVSSVCIVQGPGECVPCRKAGCEDRSDSRSDCLDQLSVNRVLEAIKQMGIEL